VTADRIHVRGARACIMPIHCLHYAKNAGGTVLKATGCCIIFRFLTALRRTIAGAVVNSIARVYIALLANKIVRVVYAHSSGS